MKLVFIEKGDKLDRKFYRKVIKGLNYCICFKNMFFSIIFYSMGF